MELVPEIYQKIEALSDKGNTFLDNGESKEAIDTWNEALALIPDPKTDWEASMWLHASIGDAYFHEGNFSAVKESFFNALNCPGAHENPFIHYRLGQALLKLGETDKGIDQLLQAYMLDGDDIFLSEDGGEDYLNLLRNRGLIS